MAVSEQARRRLAGRRRWPARSPPRRPDRPGRMRRGSGAGSDAAPDSATASNGPSGTAQPADTPSSTGSSSATQPQSSASGSAVQSSSSTVTSAPAASGTGGLPPTPLEAALARVAPLSSSRPRASPAVHRAARRTPSRAARVGRPAARRPPRKVRAGRRRHDVVLEHPVEQRHAGRPAAVGDAGRGVGDEPAEREHELPIPTRSRTSSRVCPCRRSTRIVSPVRSRCRSRSSWFAGETTCCSIRAATGSRRSRCGTAAGKDGSTESLLKRELRTMVRRRARSTR